MSTTIEQEPLYRYPGTKPFESNEYCLFKGRDEDIKNLSELVSLQNLVVLFGRSGLGKSSLLNAGLVNSFRDPAIVPVFLRFGAYYDKNTITPLEKLRGMMSDEQQTNSSNFIFEKLIPKEEITIHRLWYFFKSLQITNPGKQKFILIFDQFEELFTYPENEIDLFKKELSELLYVSVPQQLRNLLKDKLLLDPEYLSKEEKDLLFSPLNIKILFSIRSDKLSLLNKLADYFPSVLKLCYELQPLNKQQARQAIEEPAKLNDKDYISPPFTFTNEAVTLLLNTLTDAKNKKDDVVADHKPEIETFQLQIVCKYAENLIIEKGLRQITAPDLGNIKEIFENHYRNIIAKLSRQKQLPARRLIEEKLIIEGMRVSMPIPFILRDQGMTRELLDELISTHILRPEQNNTVEISHDTLIEPILKYYEERKKQEAIALELHEKEEQIKRIKEEQEKQINEEKRQQELRAQQLKTRRNKVIISIVSAALILTICLAVYAFEKSTEAVKQKEFAIQKSRSADSSARIAQLQREIADSNAEDAQVQKHRADSIAEKEASALSDAVAQKKRADSSAIYANQEKNKAIQARKDVESVEEAFRLTVLAGEWVDKDPTVALRIAETAIQKHPDSVILKVAHQIFKQNSFYKIINNRLSNPETSFFSPDGRSILTSDGLQSLEGKTLWRFGAYTGSIRCAAFSSDLKQILTGSNDDTVRLWNAGGNLLRKFIIPTERPGSVAFISSVTFSPDGKRIFASYQGYGPACIWNIDGTPIWIMQNAQGTRISSGAFTHDDKYVFTGYTNGKARIWEIDTPHNVISEFNQYMGSARSAIFSADDKSILTNYGLLNTDSTTWKFDSGGGEICSAVFSPDGSKIITRDCYGHIARLWDINGPLLRSFKGHTGTINSVVFSSDGNNILTSSADSTIRLWTINKYSVLLNQDTIRNNQGSIASMTLSPDAKRILTSNGDKTARLWSMDGSIERDLKLKDTITSVAFSPDGTEILTGSSDGIARIFNINGTFLKELNIQKDEGPITSVAFAWNKNSIVTGSENGKVKLWSMAGTFLNEISLQKKDILVAKPRITSLAFSPDGDNILIGYSRDNNHGGVYESVDLYSVEGTLFNHFENYSTAAFSPDSNKIVLGSMMSNSVAEYTVYGTMLSSDKTHESRVISVAYSSDGTKVISGSRDGVVKLWESTMTLEKFLQSNKISKLTEEQKKQFGTK